MRVYAFTQNLGMVNDHIHGCVRASDQPTLPRPTTTRYSGSIAGGYKAIFDGVTALPKVIIAAMKGDAMVVVAR